MVQLFQLLIANNDFSVIKGSRDQDCCHNVLVLGTEDVDSARIPVPFDFDMSGMVNTGYAAPPSQLPTSDVRQRYFNGLCQPDEIMAEAIAHVQSKRDEILALYENSAELDARNKSKSVDYIKDFFDILDSPKRMQREIVGRCRGRGPLEQMLESSTDPT